MEEIKEKKCKQCGEVKPFTEFSKQSKSKDGYKYTCKSCDKEYRKTYYVNNKDIVNNRNNKYYYDNKDKTRNKRIEYNRLYRKLNKPKRNIQLKNRKQIDPLFKMSIIIRNRTYNAVKYHNLSKTSSTMQMLGCDIETLMNHLQPTGMRYDPNFNIYDYDSTLYHIDHIKTFADVEKGIYTLEEVCHYTNLQILPAEMNLSKSGTSW